MKRITQILVAVACPLLGSCGGDATADTPAAPADQYVVAIDISGSRRQKQLQEAQSLVEHLILTRVRNGDRLVLMEMFGHRAGLPDRWDDSVRAARDPQKPTSADQRRLDDFREEALSFAPDFFSATRAKTIVATDIFSTLQEAADLAKASQHRRTTVVLLSDMIHATGELNMARVANIPDERWIAERKQQGRLPDLRGLCVVVAGADVSSAHGTALRRFWTSYLAASGATLGDYRNLIASSGELACR